MRRLTHTTAGALASAFGTEGDALADWARWRGKRLCGTKVFLSYTSEFGEPGPGDMFVKAASDATVVFGRVPLHMQMFTPSPGDAPAYCEGLVASAAVYVGIIGHKYGSTVPPGHELSYTELEFEAATACELPRLIFLVRAPELPIAEQSPEARERQLSFRERLRNHPTSNPVVQMVDVPHQISSRLVHALGRLWLPPPKSDVPPLAVPYAVEAIRRDWSDQQIDEARDRDAPGASRSVDKPWDGPPHQHEPEAVREARGLKSEEEINRDRVLKNLSTP